MVSDVQVLDFHHVTRHLSRAPQHAVSREKWHHKWRRVLCHGPGGVEMVTGGSGLPVAGEIRKVRQRMGKDHGGN